ncbi:MAG: hypothetical protein JW798_01500 [Prolixibacteraceae bacterium]|nr:hypothetical protein [Prolixibacteraceae bacterium]
MKKLYLLICLLLFGILSSAQVSTLLEKGKSGIGIKGSYKTTTGIYALGGKVGASISGKVDIELCYKNYFWNRIYNDLLLDNATSAYYEGRVTWWLFRKEVVPGIDINFGLIGGYNYCSYNNFTYSSDYDSSIIFEDSHFTDGQFGLMSSASFRVADSWYLQPSFGIVFDMGQMNVLKNGEPISFSTLSIVSYTGLTIMKRFSNGSGVYTEAQQILETQRNYPAYQFSIGYVLPL